MRGAGRTAAVTRIVPGSKTGIPKTSDGNLSPCMSAIPGYPVLFTSSSCNRNKKKGFDQARHSLPAPALPADSSSAAESPVEIKGYKNIVKLPDWLFQHNISVKSEKPYQNGRIYLLESCPFSPAHNRSPRHLMIDRSRTPDRSGMGRTNS